MPSCIICKSSKRKFNYFRFPQDEEQKKKWLEFTQLNSLQCTADTRLCSQHFSDDCVFQKSESGKYYLKAGSIPSVFIEPTRRRTKKSKYAKTICILCGNKAIGDSYFIIPKQPEVRTKWESFCNLTLDNERYRLCHRHFNKADVVVTNSTRRLKKDALPTIYFDDIQFEYIPVDCATHRGQSVSCSRCAPKNSKNRIPTCDNNDPCVSSTVEDGEFLQQSNLNDEISKGAAVHEIFLATDNTIEDIPILDEGDDENRLPDTLETEPPEANRRRKRAIRFPGDINDDEVNDLAEARKLIAIMRKTIDRKNRQIKQMRQKTKRLDDKIVKLQVVVHQYKEKDEFESRSMDWW